MFLFYIFYSLFINYASVVLISKQAHVLCLFLAKCSFVDKIEKCFIPFGLQISSTLLKMVVVCFLFEILALP